MMNHGGTRNTASKVVGGLALVVGLGVLISALNGGGWSLAAALPFLLILACPLMMLFMMGSMGHDHMDGSEHHHDVASEDLPDLAGLPRDQQVRALRQELTRMAWRQESLRQTLEQVEGDQKAERVVDAESATGARYRG
jgi:hypothetical protein